MGVHFQSLCSFSIQGIPTLVYRRDWNYERLFTDIRKKMPQVIATPRSCAWCCRLVTRSLPAGAPQPRSGHHGGGPPRVPWARCSFQRASGTQMRSVLVETLLSFLGNDVMTRELICSALWVSVVGCVPGVCASV